MKRILPLGENVLVKIIENEKVTESGIVLPDTVSQERPQEAEVVAVGDSEKINRKIKKGALILFSKYSGTEIKKEEREYLLLNHKDILAVIE